MSHSLPLLPVPRRPFQRKRIQLGDPSSSVLASPKRVSVHASSSHSFASVLFCLVLTSMPRPGGNIVAA